MASEVLTAVEVEMTIRTVNVNISRLSKSDYTRPICVEMLQRITVKVIYHSTPEEQEKG